MACSTDVETCSEIAIINPYNGDRLTEAGHSLADESGNTFPVIADVPRICSQENYSSSFGYQWNRFSTTQIDDYHKDLSLSSERFFATTVWPRGGLQGENVLEVGSGAGRFTNVVLSETQANLWSVDYSEAVEANWKLNGNRTDNRLRLFQASIYDLPFRDGSFDKTFCMGVLQHTPDFAKSVEALVVKTRIGGEIVVDFYPIKGFWTKIHAKYIFRPLTKKMDHERLLSVVERNVDWMISLSRMMCRVRLGALTRFIPLVDIRGFMAAGLKGRELREWAVLDTFDMYSPEYDQPQRLEKVQRMFERAGASVVFAGLVPMCGSSGTVIRAVRQR